MTYPELTERPSLARSLLMQGPCNGGRRRSRMAGYAAMVLVGGAMINGGCVSVNAPDKPIVIELNINIKQEVVYRLAADAGNTIEENSDIF